MRHFHRNHIGLSTGLLSILAFVAAGILGGEEPESPVLLRFRQIPGDVIHADALVREQVHINGYFSHDAEISESSATRIRSVDSGGNADLESEFITLETVAGYPGFLEWESSEKVLLRRDSMGYMDVPLSAARPVIRNIPIFPEDPVSPGDSWTAEAEEVHLFRIGGRLWGPYRGKMPVSFVYEGEEEQDGLRLGRISMDYNLYLPVGGGGPVRIVSGTSSQLLYWNLEEGVPVRKEETFEFLILMSEGSSQEIVGAQTVTYRTLTELDRPEVMAAIRDTAGPQAVVSDTEDGILLTLDDTGRILFSPESAEISPDQEAFLRQLSTVLNRYPERDILITGHTADYGSPEGRQQLSRERAEAVAAILFPRGRSGEGRLYLRGLGSGKPVGSDAENRRVEILIMD